MKYLSNGSDASVLNWIWDALAIFAFGYYYDLGSKECFVISRFFALECGRSSVNISLPSDFGISLEKTKTIPF